MAGKSLVGSQVGHIRLEAKLGAGGMGEVYRGHDTRLDRRVAVKTIRAEQRFDPEMKSRFLREARILSKLEHPSICQVFDLVEGASADFLIFEYVDGQTLKDLFADGRLPTTTTLEIAEKIVLALAAAHRERIVHRDLKPENVMVTAGGGVKILDFGISRAVRDPLRETGPAAAPVPPAPGREMPGGPVTATLRQPLPANREVGAPRETVAVPAGAKTAAIAAEAVEDPAATLRIPEEVTAVTLDADLTQRGFVLGTVRYMSPEQARAEEVAEPSDLYSFGILLQEMLSGLPAYAPRTPAELVPDVSAARTVPLEGFDPEITALVERLKSRTPAARPTAAEAAERLRYLLDRPAREARQRRRRQLTAVAIALLLVVLTVVSVLAVRAAREAERASREAANSRAVVDFVVNLFNEAAPGQRQGAPLSVAELVDRGAERAAADFADRPLDRARFQDEIGMLYWRLGHFPAAQQQLEAALATREQLLPPGDLELARNRYHLGVVVAERDPAAAEALFTRALGVYREAPAAAVELAGLLNDYGDLLSGSGDLAAARPLLEEALALDLELYGPASGEVAERRITLGKLFLDHGELAAARAQFEPALMAMEARGEKGYQVGVVLNDLGLAYRKSGELERAEAAGRRALAILGPIFGEDHPITGMALATLGRTLAARGKNEEALNRLEKALAIETAARGKDGDGAQRLAGDVAELRRKLGWQERETGS